MTRIERIMIMKLESGSASLVIEMHKGALVVKHGIEGDVLLAGPLPEGGWSKLLKGILEAAPDAVGTMRGD